MFYIFIIIWFNKLSIDLEVIGLINVIIQMEFKRRSYKVIKIIDKESGFHVILSVLEFLSVRPWLCP